MRTVGVVGAGTIGRGLAQSLAMTGHEVVLVDIAEEALDDALAQIRRDLRFARMLGAQSAGAHEPVDTVLERLRPTTDHAELKAAEFVVENVVEDWDVKSEVYRILDSVCPEETVFAANTSCVPITRIGAQTRRPDRILGMHFMNPVPLKPVVEVIRAVHTSDATVETALRLLSGMGKEGIVVNDSPGFVSNRVMMLAVNEAAYLVYEGVADAASVDRIFTTCFGHRMGMLETADLIGLDTILRSVEVLHERFGDSKYRPCPLLRQLVDAGYLGRKSGRGFHTYEQ
ncbi:MULTISPECIES: 3-hydroxyacyl-CoA dehydrogenase family protein [unclassified Streptomyces]|uniref:3-hydroxyacyl-CoA dehydrogenase family protein n=1 Tax=unclassified Streptomyces TaxID=2593676 RepID=UPI002E14D9D5|nr:3-hydroxyacyl-CoA dehydrogenase family protein [Streptomyces sp. NBC_01197]WSS47249.1 3-hydroxyacyl-CoA dehydrogenase family protein [Streptomyces sp. NBC_01180]